MKKILVIEDNVEVRENLLEILELSGYEVHGAENGKIGVRKVEEIIPDLILCDVMMPELDGFGVLKILNNNKDFRHIPFMFLTAKAEKTDFRKGMGLGADDYITKPYDDVELLEALEIRLKKSEQVQAVDQSDQSMKAFFDLAKGEAAFNELSEDQETRSYAKKQTVYEAGQYPKWLYQVVSGQLKAYQSNDMGKELITHIHGPRDIFGYLPSLTNQAYAETVTAINDSVVKLISLEDFQSLLFNHRDFAAKFIQLLAQQALDSEGHLIDIAYSSVRKKVANALVNIFRNREEDNMDIMREDLASMAGTAKETTIRTLSDFKNEKLIVVEGHNIKILDMRGLKNMPQ